MRQALLQSRATSRFYKVGQELSYYKNGRVILLQNEAMVIIKWGTYLQSGVTLSGAGITDYDSAPSWH